VQALRFSTEDYRPHERVAAWRELFGRTLLKVDIAPVADEGAFKANAVASQLPDFGLLRASTMAAYQHNTPALISNDNVSFGWSTSDHWSASQLGRDADMRSGDGVLMSNSDVGSVSMPKDCALTIFSMPRSVVAPLVPDLGALFARRIPVSMPALQMLMGYLELAPNPEFLGTSALAGLFTTHVRDLLALALGATRDSVDIAEKRGVAAARLLAMQEDIRGNLSQSELSVHWIAARQGVSARLVQKLFDESGSTFTQYVLEQRLSAAYRAFAARPATPINEIVYELGFSDLSNFNRAFRRRFGCTPSDVRYAARGPGDGTP
jgi:AraC-like DNA-binding protein